MKYSHPLFFALGAALLISGLAALYVWWQSRATKPRVGSLMPPTLSGIRPMAMSPGTIALPTLVSIENPIEAVRQALSAGDLATEKKMGPHRPFLDTSPLTYQVPDEGRLKSD